jgi:hypothetical protein
LPINAYLRWLLAVRKDGGQNLLLQEIETGLDIDAAIVRDGIVADSEETIEIDKIEWIVMEKTSQKYGRERGNHDRKPIARRGTKRHG